MSTVAKQNLNVPDLLRGALPPKVNIDELFAQFNESVEDEIEQLVKLRDAGNPVIPDVTFSQLCKSGFSRELAQSVRRRGCVIVRGVYEVSQVQRWNDDLDRYLAANRYYENLQADIDAGIADRAKHVHMLDIFWSKPQTEIRQSSNLKTLLQQLNGLWKINAAGPGAFDPDSSYTYADRIRIRQPFDSKHGLSPHVDNCSMESWFSSNTISNAYSILFNGQWQDFDAFDSKRAITDRKPHPDSCGVFRTYQGWMALTPQGEDCGSLQLVPSSRCVAWMFLSMLKDAAEGDSLVSPLPSEAYMLHPDRHATLAKGLCSLPLLKQGDTVWWHPDAVHAVEQFNRTELPSSVVYLGSAPKCERNRQYAQSQLNRFIKGESPPDYPGVHVEANYIGRATQKDLTTIGLEQMGLDQVALV